MAVSATVSRSREASRWNGRSGDREADTIVGARHSGAIVPLVDWESKSRFPTRFPIG